MSEFKRGDLVKHMITRKTYKIVSSAENCKLKSGADWVPAYAYQGMLDTDDIVYVQEQKRMEERFVRVDI